MTALSRRLCLATPSGHDTTASLVAWTLWYLMKHPEVEAKLVAEVLGVMGPDTQPSYQQLSDMRYLNAVLKVGAAGGRGRNRQSPRGMSVNNTQTKPPFCVCVVKGTCGGVAGGGKVAVAAALLV